MNLHCFIILKNTAKQVVWGGCFVFRGFAGSMVPAAGAYYYRAHHSLGVSG